MRMQPSEQSKEIIEIRTKYPCMTMQDIGNKFGITRERVRQILDRAKKPTRPFNYNKPRICNQCGRPTKNKVFCSKKCLKDYYSIQLPCGNCGKIVKLDKWHRRTIVKNKSGLIFCNLKCFGKWHSLNTTLPKNCFVPRNYDYDIIREKYIETGYGSTRLSKLLNIPDYTISYVLKLYRKQSGLKYDIKLRKDVPIKKVNN